MHDIKKTLIVRASGGLSNRLQAVICGIAYCLLTDRAICVDWRDGLYSDDFSNSFPLWFNILGMESISYEDVLKAYQSKASIHPIYWKDWISEPIAVEYLFNGNEHTLPQNKEFTSIDLSNDQLDDDILVFWDWHIMPINALIPKLKEKFPHLASLEDSEIPSYLLKQHVQPTEIILQDVDTFFAKHFEQAPIGIHIRHTDLQSPLPKLLDKLQEIAGENKIFLCTDNEQVEKMVCKLFPNTVTCRKIYQGTNVPLHSYTEGISNVQKGHEAVIDMLLLSRCKQIIHYTQSSFARISILFSKIPSSAIHAINN